MSTITKDAGVQTAHDQVVGLVAQRWARSWQCQITINTEVERPKGVVPHYLPGTNNELTAYANYYKLPYDASKGGAETMYPEYLKKLKQMMTSVQTSSQKTGK